MTAYPTKEGIVKWEYDHMKDATMAWIEVHQSLPMHRKTYKLAKLTGRSRTECVGGLVSLWVWALDNAPSGDITDVDNDHLADIMGLDVEGDTLFASMVHAGFIDNGSCINELHDWRDYAGRLLEARERQKVRQQEYRNRRSGRNDNVTGTATSQFASTVPYPTVPYPTPLPSGNGTPAAAKTSTKKVQSFSVEEMDHVKPVIDALELSDVAASDIKRLVDILKDARWARIDVERVAADYMGWQHTVSAKHQHKDRIAALRKQLEMKKDQSAYWKADATPATSAPTDAASVIMRADRDISTVDVDDASSTVIVKYDAEISLNWLSMSGLPAITSHMREAGCDAYGLIVLGDGKEIYRR